MTTNSSFSFAPGQASRGLGWLNKKMQLRRKQSLYEKKAIIKSHNTHGFTFRYETKFTPEQQVMMLELKLECLEDDFMRIVDEYFDCDR